jgi:hypothetical protein
MQLRFGQFLTDWLQDPSQDNITPRTRKKEGKTDRLLKYGNLSGNVLDFPKTFSSNRPRSGTNDDFRFLDFRLSRVD